jgi:hypothetical protein
VITNFYFQLLTIELKMEQYSDLLMNVSMEAMEIQSVEDLRKPDVEEDVLQISLVRITSQSSLVTASQPITVASTTKENLLELRWYTLCPSFPQTRMNSNDSSTTHHLFKFMMIRRNPAPSLPEYGWEIYIRLLQVNITLHDLEFRWLMDFIVHALAENITENIPSDSSLPFYRIRTSNIVDLENEPSIPTSQVMDAVFNTFKAHILLDGPVFTYIIREQGPRLVTHLETILIQADTALALPKLAQNYLLCDERQVNFPSRPGDFNSVKPKKGDGVQLTRIAGHISPLSIYYHHDLSLDRELMLSFDAIPFAIDWDNTSCPQFQCGIYVNDVK